jgi:hypothetical protein
LAVGIGSCHAKTPVRLGPQYAKLPSCILSFTPSFLLRNQASILIFSRTLNKDTISLLRSITRPRSSYVIVAFEYGYAITLTPVFDIIALLHTSMTVLSFSNSKLRESKLPEWFLMV